MKSSFINLQVIKTYPEIAHVKKPSFVFYIDLVSHDYDLCLKIVTVELTH